MLKYRHCRGGHDETIFVTPRHCLWIKIIENTTYYDYCNMGGLGGVNKFKKCE